MKKYRVYFNGDGKRQYKKAIEEIYGFSEDDALVRNGYDLKLIDSIMEVFI